MSENLKRLMSVDVGSLVVCTVKDGKIVSVEPFREQNKPEFCGRRYVDDFGEEQTCNARLRSVFPGEPPECVLCLTQKMSRLERREWGVMALKEGCGHKFDDALALYPERDAAEAEYSAVKDETNAWTPLNAFPVVTPGLNHWTLHTRFDRVMGSLGMQTCRFSEGTLEERAGAEQDQRAAAAFDLFKTRTPLERVYLTNAQVFAQVRATLRHAYDDVYGSVDEVVGWTCPPILRPSYNIAACSRRNPHWRDADPEDLREHANVCDSPEPFAIYLNAPDGTRYQRWQLRRAKNGSTLVEGFLVDEVLMLQLEGSAYLEDGELVELWRINPDALSDEEYVNCLASARAPHKGVWKITAECFPLYAASRFFLARDDQCVISEACQ